MNIFVLKMIRNSLFLCAFLLFIFVAVPKSLPDLRGVEKGVSIKIRAHGKKNSLKYISPSAEGFVHSKALPKYVTGAIIISEDEEFFSHNGINPEEIMDAAKYDIKHLSLKCGGSTITQQLVKNVYLSNKRTFSRKIIEAVTAVKLEKKLTKRQILDYYINIVEFGDGVYGIRHAANYYFDKAPENLTAREAAMLAVLMPKPKARGKDLLAMDKDKFQKRRVKRLLAKMKRSGYLEDGV